MTKYATRLMNEMDLNNSDRRTKFYLQSGKVVYEEEVESDVVNIVEKKGDTEKVVYRIYEFSYRDILCESFIKYNPLHKSALVFALVIQKMPSMFAKMFKKDPYQRPFQIFYVFMIFMIISALMLMLIPTAIDLILQAVGEKTLAGFFGDSKIVNALPATVRDNFTSNGMGRLSRIFVAVAALIAVLMPNIKVNITALATEFVCAHYYLEYGQKSQKVLGRLDRLVEYISENEPDPIQIHYHAYSFGSIIAIDHLYPYGSRPAEALNQTELLVTIGTPFEFINAYYPDYFSERAQELDRKIHWINVFSVADALASNFRLDNGQGEAEYGIIPSGNLPVNQNYEISRLKGNGIISFIFMHSMRAHSVYWDTATNGQSCLKQIVRSMAALKML